MTGHAKLMSVVKAIEGVLPPERPIEHHKPYINGHDFTCVADCLGNDLATTKWSDRTAQWLADKCGVEQAVCTASGTTALQLALLAVGVKPNEEVLVPALTFIGTANAVYHVGAHPNFVDSSILGINAYKLRRYLENTTIPNPDKRGRLNLLTGRVISCLIVVDLLGFPADLPKLEEVAKEFGLTLIEDAAQALGSSLGNRQCGSFGAAAIFSFNNNKIVTGGGGGAVLTNDPLIAANVWKLANTDRIAHPWKIEHAGVAYNYRCPQLCAALIYSQLAKLGWFISYKRVLAHTYATALAGTDLKVMLAQKDHQGSPNYWLTTGLLEPPIGNKRDELLTELHNRGIKARALFTPLHQLPMYKDNPRDKLQYTEDAAARAICLPSGVDLI
jgi:perosamine synthetase